jgi:hypothetical protein
MSQLIAAVGSLFWSSQQHCGVLLNVKRNAYSYNRREV